jgi:ABC-2 type transport system ATP-binding protein
VLVIEAEGLEKRYGGGFRRASQLALRGVDLAVPAGVGFGLIGPNGAGKTTFVKALLGVVQPTAGRIRLLGGDPRDPAIRARVGYLPERLELSPGRTPLQILDSVARFKGLRLGRSQLYAMLDQVGIAQAGGRRVGGFSKGMKQRVGLAAALIGRPELLVLDEPTDGLDPMARVEVRTLLQQAIVRGATLLLNSHLLAETERVCDQVGVLVEGRIVRQGPLDRLGVDGTWRIRFADPPPPRALEAAGVTPGPAGTWRLEGDVAALNEALDAARKHGALVVEVGRDGQDLEAVLAAALLRGAP